MRAYKLTRKQKTFISAAAPCLNVDNWLMLTETNEEITLVHKLTKTKRVIKK
ncbi:MAG: hypothetical protein Q4G33_05910 [bacterium]|nr:hypothetical protein [bacterium]